MKKIELTIIFCLFLYSQLTNFHRLILFFFLQVTVLLQQMQDRFQTMSDQILTRIDDMGTRVDDLEKNINDLMTQTGTEDMVEK